MKHTPSTPSLSEANKAWAKIGFLSFGGPAAQISLMHRVIVDENKWLKERQFLNALNFCMLLPGPEAMQLATYAGWRMHGLLGGLIAGLWFVLPGAFIILALAGIYAAFGNVPFIEALFLGVKAAVLVIVVQALLKVSSKALLAPIYYAIAALSFIGIFFLHIPYPFIVMAAGLSGFFMKHGDEETEEDPDVRFNVGSTIKSICTWLAIWWVPIAVLWFTGAQPILIEIAIFFSKLAVVTFGGAYAVLAYMAQDVVQINGWLTATQMVDALGLAETTPGPLILVTEFVGFLAAYSKGGFWLGAFAAAITIWVTFVPCFLWIFTGAPYIEWISSRPRLRSALSAITAAVVGVILNLSLWFSIHVLFSKTNTIDFGLMSLIIPQMDSFVWQAAVSGLAAAILLLVMRWNMIAVLAISALGGLALSTI